MSDRDASNEKEMDDGIVCPLCNGRGRIKISKWRAILRALMRKV